MIAGIRRSAFARCAPFAAFMALLALRASLADAGIVADARWVYGASVLVTGALLAWFWREYGELARANRPNGPELLLGAATGLVLFAAWIRLDAPWMQFGAASAPFVPTDDAGGLDGPLVAVRWFGAALLVPVMEELFWRSFLMRWIEAAAFEAVDPQRVGLKAVMLSTFVFMLVHTLWLAAVVAGLAYAWLYRRTGKLWVPIVAHAVTNGALGIWIVATGNWAFW